MDNKDYYNLLADGLEIALARLEELEPEGFLEKWEFEIEILRKFREEVF